MNDEMQTRVGRIVIDEAANLFRRAVELVADHAAASTGDLAWALTGGTTPAVFYNACVAGELIPRALLERMVWTTSDERFVPLDSVDSNFGNAAKLFLDPLGVQAGHRMPWTTDLPPVEAARSYADRWGDRMGEGRVYDICFLGMGGDCHVASLFPGSPLLKNPQDRDFAAVDVPGKGWRMTATAEGIMKSGLVVVMVMGAGKARALKRVVHGTFDPYGKPAQILAGCAARVVWLVDREAAAELESDPR